MGHPRDNDTTSTDIDYLMRKGAEAAQPRLPGWYLLLTCALAMAFGAAYDMPFRAEQGGWFIRTAVVGTAAIAWFAAGRVAWNRARPRSAAYSRALKVGFFAGLALLYVAASLLGIGLQRAGSPMPFTLAGLAFGVVFVLAIRLTAAHISARYYERVRTGQW